MSKTESSKPQTIITYQIEGDKIYQGDPNSVINNDLAGGGSESWPETVEEQIETQQTDNKEVQIVHSMITNANVTKLRPKTIGLKRVSFAAPNCFMVEIPCFKTPTSPYEESAVDLYEDRCNTTIKDELELSVLRVSIYQSTKPQHIRLPDFLSKLQGDLALSLVDSEYNIIDIMTTTDTMPHYTIQSSCDAGWENPFRPDGVLSREADEIVKLISGGKTISPLNSRDEENRTTEKDEIFYNGTVSKECTATNISPAMATKERLQEIEPPVKKEASKGVGNRNAAPVQISNQVLPGPTSASHVIVGEKKTKGRGCCVLQ